MSADLTSAETRSGASSRPPTWKAWLLASRPPTLAAAVVPVAIGTAVAYAVAGSEGLRWLPALACLWGAIWIQIGTNFANDVFDFEKGADTGERLGPVRAVQAGWIRPAEMRKAMWLAFALASLAGIYLTVVAGWPLLVIGVLSILSGIAYTGGPYPLGYNGLGDVFVLVFFGFVAVCGTVFVILGWVPSLAWWASIPPGVLATNILVVNNLRDRGTDVLAGKRTLAVRFGKRAGQAELLVMMLAAYATPIVLFVLGLVGSWTFLPWLTLPLTAPLIKGMWTLEGAELNGILVGSARLLVLFGGLFALGLTLDRALGVG